MASKSGVSKGLAAERKKRGLTYAKFAALLGVSVTSAFDWENGTHEPPIKKLRKIARRLGVDVGAFFGAAS